MKTSEQIDKLTAALVKAQSTIEAPTKDKTAKIGAYSYSYADLAAIINATRKPLADAGLAVTSTTEANGHVILVSRLLHTSGQWIEASYPLPSDCTPQQMGSAITYGRRYTICSLLGIVAEDDDDGAAASQPKEAPAKKNYVVPAAGATRPPAIKAPAPAPQADPDAVPHSVTDAAPVPLVVEDAEPMEIATVKAFSKEKTDKKGNAYRGVLLIHADNTEKWWNLYNAETIAALGNMKGRQVYAKLEMKGEYPLCHNLTVSA